MKDRIPTYPGRVVLTPVNGSTHTYDMELADVPIQEGTPLNRDSLLKDNTAGSFGLGEDAVPDDILKKIRELISEQSESINILEATVSSTTPISKGGTGQTSAAKAIQALVNGISELTNTTIASNDCFPVNDIDAGLGKKITLLNLLNYIRANMVIYSTTDIGTNANLATGAIYLVYE